MKNRLVCVLVVFMIIFTISVNTFAAVVSDNDASALVTIEEFKAYQKNFDSKIATYANGVTNFIDGAIVVYLADFAGASIENGNPIDY